MHGVVRGPNFHVQRKFGNNLSSFDQIKRSQHAGAYTFGFFIHSNSPFSPFCDLFILTHLFPNFVNLIIQMVLFTNIESMYI